jgi:predicted DNA-binding transcriptional regulator AlpA
MSGVDVKTEDRVLRRRDCAARVGIHPSTWWRWQKWKIAPPDRVFGPRVRGVLESEFTAWLASRQAVAK